MGRLFGKTKGALRDIRRSVRAASKNAIVLAAFSHVSVIVFLFPTEVMGLEDESSHPTDEEFEQALLIGSGGNGGLIEEQGFDVVRFGMTTVFRESGDENRGSLELVCLLCTPAEALTKARSFGAALSEKRQSGESSVVFCSEPVLEGILFLDGIPVAPSCSRHKIEPGEHHVKKQTESGEFEAEFSVEPGGTVDMATLEMTSVSKKLRPAIVLVGLGLTAAALGGVFLWLDGNCATTVVDSDGDCQKQHNTKGLGWGLLAGGIIIDVSAIVWLLWPESSRRMERRGTE